MNFRSVIVARMVPGSEDKIADVFARNDEATRPQDFGVIGRTLLSLHDLYIHVIERNADPKVSGQTRGLPAFKQVSDAIAPYVTPYPRNWKVPSDSVAKEFYSWVPGKKRDAKPRAAANQTVIVARIKPGAEPDVARIFAESDAGTLPRQMGVTGRWLYSIDDVYLHVLEQTDAAFNDTMRKNHDLPAFHKIMEDLKPYISAYSPETWRGPVDAVAREFYRWRVDA
ncbi:MAG TPA: TcmI family type II polyketide cyclase [Amycolatopsis sp.]|uniref:TcmI family type II polyketide cyclase n=1 Tax=Amycolatopsis sp. TaxID=37632 RepID=UPI002B493E50|nr:TcmI family type II polyketide cyclase [Amycolatopsis sp.]HKS49986.1 TcmI family type II polyketide cyclase [Amycolatopsis sp.]